uniref:OCRE domain-containing protein n=1 Tax=Auxenochlorella protothecoides TaxID=3075 RepID=A0A1D1ZWD4_AUXPR
MSSPAKSRKRVRFSDQPQIREFEPALFPAAESTDLQDLEGGIDAVHLTTVDPARAASDRAKRRRDALMMSFEEGMEGDELAAEAEYDDIPVSSRLEHSARLEPFHMKRERELGYFDAETGDYVEYASRRDVPDAWADALPVTESMEDEEDSESAEEAEIEMGADKGGDPALLRKTIVHALREGETVLSALRRIAREREVATGGGAAAAPLRRASMLPAAAAAFEELTDAAAQLMRSVGDFGLYSKTREQIAAGGAAALGPAAAGGLTATPGPSLTLMAGRGASNGDAGAATFHNPPPPADAELNIYGEEGGEGRAETPVSERPLSPADAEARAAGEGDSKGPRLLPSPLAQAQPSPSSPEPKEEGPAPSPVPSGVGSDPLDGFQLDPGSGQWVNHSLGCTFDPATQLYGDVESGAWYRWQDGQYHPVVTGSS